MRAKLNDGGYSAYQLWNALTPAQQSRAERIAARDRQADYMEVITGYAGVDLPESWHWNQKLVETPVLGWLAGRSRDEAREYAALVDAARRKLEQSGVEPAFATYP